MSANRIQNCIWFLDKVNNLSTTRILEDSEEQAIFLGIYVSVVSRFPFSAAARSGGQLSLSVAVCDWP
jgi:hypothetical protein